jgi:hexosaminidase
LTLVFDEKFEQEARYLENRLNGYYNPGTSSTTDLRADIRLRRQKARYQEQSKEAYDLIIGPEGIEIRAEENAGIFYGVQSLLALQKEAPLNEGIGRLHFPHAKIYDQPRFGYRGFQLDVGRNFQSKETIKKLIDVLAYYKINTFLFYLTEDEGWRIEIEGLPELTEVGGQRQHASIEDPALHPSYGSGPEAYAEGTFGSGYYSKSDFIEILRYARQRHIQVIPEVNLPGHARAAIKAMEKRYAHYMEKGDQEEAERYRLIDPDDTSEYSSAQSFKDNVVCVCRESVYDFYEKVIDVILSYYEEAGVPLEYFHVGGDEVPSGPWTKSPLCEELLNSNQEISGPENLHAYFFDRAVSILKERGLTIAGWEEVALKKVHGENQVNPEFADGTVVPYVWNTLWGAQDLGYRLANSGYPVVLCPVTNFYFDLAYNKDPLEPGLHWAGFVDTRNAYQYAPFDVFKTTTRDDSYYTPIDTDKAFAGMERLEAGAKKNILGVQAQLWSETLKGREMMEYYLLPKLLGYAESAWSKERAWEATEDKELREKQADMGWNELANRIGKNQFKKLDHLFGGFAYRIPPPGAKSENGMLYANTAYPDLVIRYTTDGSEPDSTSAIYLEPLLIESNSPVKLKAYNQTGRESRTTTLTALNSNFLK